MIVPGSLVIPRRGSLPHGEALWNDIVIYDRVRMTQMLNERLTSSALVISVGLTTSVKHSEDVVFLFVHSSKTLAYTWIDQVIELES